MPARPALLVAEKEAFRDLEAAATAAHFAGAARVRRGGGQRAASRYCCATEAGERHLVAAAAYPVLEGQGELLPSRLRLDS